MRHVKTLAWLVENEFPIRQEVLGGLSQDADNESVTMNVACDNGFE
jgi:hypothetical protein